MVCSVEIGDRIRVARKAKGLTQKQLAEKLNIATITIQQYERGKRNPSWVMLIAIARTLSIPSTKLFLNINDDLADEFEKELRDFEERQEPIASRLSKFLLTYPEFISYLNSIGFQIKLDSNNVIWVIDKDTDSYEFELNELHALCKNTENNIYHSITDKWPNIDQEGDSHAEEGEE